MTLRIRPDAILQENEALHAENERLRTALGRIVGKNSLDDTANFKELASAAFNALYECELIAREALEKAMANPWA